MKEAQQELCQMAGALKDSKAKVATGKAIYSGLNQLHNQVRHGMYILTMCGRSHAHLYHMCTCVTK